MSKTSQLSFLSENLPEVDRRAASPRDRRQSRLHFLGLRKRRPGSAAMLALRRLRSLGTPLRTVSCAAPRFVAQRVAPRSIGCRCRSTITPGWAPVAAEAAVARTPVATTIAAPLAEAGTRAVGWWLLGTSGCVFGMVIVGGITRLTRSGLSMVDWRPQGRGWPQDTAEWECEFDKYKQFPEYQRMHKGTGMSLDDFKNIYFWSVATPTPGPNPIPDPDPSLNPNPNPNQGSGSTVCAAAASGSSSRCPSWASRHGA